MINFPFGTNGKFVILGVPILKHITVGVIRCLYFWHIPVRPVKNWSINFLLFRQGNEGKVYSYIQEEQVCYFNFCQVQREPQWLSELSAGLLK